MYSDLTPENQICNRHHAISLLFPNSPEILHFFFEADRSDIRWKDIRTLRRWAERSFDESESLLIDLALDIWFETRRVRAVDLSTGVLGPLQLEAAFNALALMLTAESCMCLNCLRRFCMIAAKRQPANSGSHTTN